MTINPNAILGSTGKPIGKWGAIWGGQWGCKPLDYHDVCRSHLWKQLENAPNFKILCQILARIALSFESEINRMEAGAGVDNAFGDELDQWGFLLDERREGATDDLFRRQIKGKARKLLGSGTVDDFFDVVDAIQENAGLSVVEAFPACVRLFFTNLTNEEQRVVFGLLTDVPALTICLQWIDVDPDGVFEFSYLNEDLTLFPIQRHWAHTDGDIPANQTAGKAFLLEF